MATLKGYTFEVEDNTGPRAIITPAEQSSILGAVVKLDGRASFDTATNPSGTLNYTWRFVRVPIGSQVEVEGFFPLDDDSSVVTFAPDITGFYEVGLVVDDGSISSPEFVASADVQILQAANNQGLVPDASFLWNYLSDFWFKVKGREKFEVLWSALIQILSAELLKLYQYDYNKSIRDIQPYIQKRWVDYSPELALDSSLVTGILAEDQAGTDAATLALDSTTGIIEDPQPSFFNLVTAPTEEADFETTSYGKDILSGRLVTVGGRSYTMARSGSLKKAVNEGHDGATTAASDSFLGSGFVAELVGMHLLILEGDDEDTYLIDTVASSTALTVTTLDGDPVSFSTTATDLSYSIVPSTDNLSSFFSDRKVIPTALAGQPWRFSSTLKTTEFDLELQGVSIGDLLEVEIRRLDINLYSTLRFHVVGVDRGRLSFVFNRDDLQTGVASTFLADEDIERLAEDLQVTGLSKDSSGVLQYALEAEAVLDVLSTATFKRTYFEAELASEAVIDLGPFSIQVTAKKVIRNGKVRVDSDLFSVPMLQEFIRQPDMAEEDGQLYLVSRSGELVEIDHQPFVLSENLDYVLDDESQVSGACNITQNVNTIEVPRGDLLDRGVQPGDVFTLTVGVTTQVFTVTRLIDTEEVEVIPTPTTTATDVPFVLSRRVGGKFVRFVDGTFDKDNPAPPRLWSEVSFFYNDPQIEANFGVLVGVTKDDLERRVVNTPYLNAVSGLMYSLTTGPTQANLRLAAQILLGLPFSVNAGVVTEINPEFRVRSDGSPKFGRILIEARDNNDSPTGVTNIYLYPQGRQLVDPDTGEFVPATPNEAGLAINPDTEVEYAVGDAVEQFAVLSKGVAVDDYLSDTSSVDRLVQQGSVSAVLSQFHSFFLRINADITTPADVDFTTEFIKESKASHLLIQAGIQSIIEDIIDIEDVLLFGREMEFFESHRLSLPIAIKFDQLSGSGHLTTFEGTMFSRYYTGDDLVTIQGNASMTSATGGFVSPLPSQSFDSPLLRGGDLLIIRDGPNAGKYDIVSGTALRLVEEQPQYAGITDAEQTGLSITKELTVEAQIRLNSLPGSPGVEGFFTIASRWGYPSPGLSWAFWVYKNSSDTVRLTANFSEDGVGGDYVHVDFSDVELGRWYDVAMRLDPDLGIFFDSFSIFVDGVERTIVQGSTLSVVSIFDSTRDFRIGAVDHNNGVRPFDGDVSNVRVWSRALSDDEIVDDSEPSRSLQFDDASAQYASIEAIDQTGLDFTEAFTLTAWIYLDDDPVGTEVLVSKWGGNTDDDVFIFQNRASSDGRLWLFVADKGVSGQPAVSISAPDAGRWIHFAFTCDTNIVGTALSDQCKAYYDGVEQAPIASSGDIAQLNDAAVRDLRIGSAFGQHFDGNIRQVRVWNQRALTQSEIIAEMSSDVALATVSLVADWPLAGDFIDESSNNNTLTPVNGPTFVFNGLQGYWPLDGNYSDVSDNGNTLTPVNDPIFIEDGRGVPDDNTILVDLEGREVETRASQSFRVYRPVQNPIFRTIVDVTNGSPIVGIDSGGLSAGVAVGDVLTFHSGSMISRDYTVIEFDPAVPEVTLDTSVEEETGSYNGNIWREGLASRYLLNTEDDTPFQADFFNRITSAAEWTAAGLPTIDGLWFFDEAAGDFLDRVGVRNFSLATGTLRREVGIPSGYGIELLEDGTRLRNGDTSFLDSPVGTSISVFGFLWMPPTDDGFRDALISKRNAGAGDFEGWAIVSTQAGTPQVILDPVLGGSAVSLSAPPAGGYRGRWTPYVMVIDRGTDELHFDTDLSTQSESIAGLGDVLSSQEMHIGVYGTGDVTEVGTLVGPVAVKEGYAWTAQERATIIEYFSNVGLVSFDAALSDLAQLAFVEKGDVVINPSTDRKHTVLDWDPTNLKAYVTPTPDSVDADQAVKIWRERRSPTPISMELLDRVPGELVTLGLRLPTGNGDLLTTAGSVEVSTVSGEDFVALGVLPGDFLVVLAGADSSLDIGYGEGVFPISELPSTTTARLTRPLTETNGSPGIRYGFRRRKSL